MLKILLSGLLLISTSSFANNEDFKINYELNSKSNQTLGSLNLDDKDTIVSNARSLLQTKYVYGGRNSAKGLDCSGLVIEVFKTIGVNFSGAARDIAKAGVKIKKEKVILGDRKAGDLLFFNTTGKPNSHVGIVINKDKFIHASTTKGKVIISNINNSYYLKKLEFAKRL